MPPPTRNETLPVENELVGSKKKHKSKETLAGSSSSTLKSSFLSQAQLNLIIIAMVAVIAQVATTVVMNPKAIQYNWIIMYVLISILLNISYYKLFLP